MLVCDFVSDSILRESFRYQRILRLDFKISKMVIRHDLLLFAL